MKKYLSDFIASKKATETELKKRAAESNDVAEVRSIGATLESLRKEIEDAEAQLAKLDEGKPDEGNEGSDEGRSSKLNPLKSYGLNNPEARNESNEDSRATMEYRKAFMDYVKTGKRSDVLQFRANDQNESGDLGVLLPTTIVNELMKETEKVYGQLYSKVKKTNIKGGVKYPIASFGATFTRIGENGAPTDRQNGGSVTGFIEFSYKLGEIRLAQTLLANILSVQVFESELSKVIVEAYVKAMDYEILNGDGSANECEGILTEAKKSSGSRIKAENIIEFTADEMLDWKTWQKKLFAKIPLSMRSLKPEFVMTANTYEANIKTLVDDNNRPLWNETYNPVDGTEKATFKAREVMFVEEGQGIVNFDDGTNGEFFGIYWVPEKAYAINTNLEFAVKRYFDEEKLQYVDRAVVINDGKVLDPKYIYLLKKKVSV